MSDAPSGGTSRHDEPDDERLLHLDALLDGVAAPRSPGTPGPGDPGAIGAGADPGLSGAGTSDGPVAGPDADLAALVGQLRSLDEQAWESAVPLGSLGLDNVVPPARSAAAPVIEGRNRWGRGPGRPARIPGRPARALVAAAAAVALLVAAAVAVAVQGATRPGRHGSTGPTSPAAWQVAGYVRQPAWSDTTATAGLSVSVTCATAARCYADAPGGASVDSAGAVVEASTDGGRTWQASPLPDGSRSTTALACPAPQQCLVGAVAGTAAGSGALAGGSPSILATTDGGSTWSAHPLPAGVTRLVAVACATPTRCVASGVAGGTPGGGQGQPVAVTTGDGGSTWTLVPLPGPFVPSGSDGLACTSQLTCVLVGTTGFATAADGTAAGHGTVLRSADGGSTWAAGTVPAGTAAVRSVACTGGGDCTAVADPPASPAAGTRATDPYGPAVALSTTDGGATWSAPGSLGLVPSTLTSIACPAPGTCWAAGSLLATPAGGGSTGVLVATEDGGATWTTAPLPTRPTAAQRRATRLTQLDIQAMVWVSCPVPSACVAIGFQSSLTSVADRTIVLAQQGS